MRKTIFYVIFIFVAASLVGMLALFYLIKTLPTVEQITNRQVSQSTKIYDRTGQVLLYEISNGQERTMIPLQSIPRYLKTATIDIEEQDFYQSPGFSLRGMIRALIVDLKHGQLLQGGSTITQQLAKNAFLTSERTFIRKVKEVLLAIQLTRNFNKDQILELYLNEIPYGPIAYGVESASETYFGKPAKDLNLAESAIVAALPKAPTYYSPWGNHVKELYARQKLILDKMAELGDITKREHDEAIKTRIVFTLQGKGIKAPHFVLAVKDYIVQKYGETMVRSGGLKVISTLDSKLQDIAERAVKNGAEENDSLYNGRNAALVAEDPKTGEILAMVGSRDYFATSSLPEGCTPGVNCQFEPNFNVVTQGLRQPGSALKPFVYLASFEKGYTPDTVVFDVPTEFTTNNPECPLSPNFEDNNQNCFHPENFDGVFRGPVSLRRALGQSINVPAVKILYLVGIKEAVKRANDFGLTTLTNPNIYGLSLVLGGGAVRLIDLVGAYSALAQNGMKTDQKLVLEVRDADGALLEASRNNGTRIADTQPVSLINNILSDIETRSGLFQNSLNLTVFPGYDVALKTGTSNDYRDAWTFGYTPSMVVGVWAGNNDNSPMQRHGSSILAAVPIWNKFMSEAIKGLPQETFSRPDPVISQKSILAGDYARDKQIHSILYYVKKNDPLGSYPSDPSQDPQFANWETGVLSWAEKNIPNFQEYNLKTTAMDGDESVNAPRVTIRNPKTGSFFANQFNITSEINGSSEIKQVNIIWNGLQAQEIAGNSQKDYFLNLNFAPAQINPQNLLEIEAIDKNGMKSKSGVIVYKQ